MESKKNNSLAIVIVLLVLVILGLVFYILYDKGIIFSKDDSTNSTETTNTNSDNTSSDTNNQTTEVKELDLTKSLNTSDITYKNSSDTEGNYGLSMKVNNDKKSVTLTIDWAIFGKVSTTGSSGEVKDYSITGFSKNVRSTFIGDLGQSYNGITLFFIMEDGTVEYTKMFKQYETGNTDGSIQYVLTASVNSDGSTGTFTSNGLVSGVKDVVKLYNVDASSQNASGYRTVIGATKDGSFYDLGSVINK